MPRWVSREAGRPKLLRGPPAAGSIGGAVVILCQHAGSSCGACCGLYNRADLSREAVRKDLRRNAALFTQVTHTPESLAAAAARRSRELPPRLFLSVRSCPLLGFLNEEETRIGCLGHPMATGGPDLRACGVYDLLTCEAFLCPSHAYLSQDEADLAAAAAGDFYLYGLVVTDAPFLKAVLTGIEARAGARPTIRDLAEPPFRLALQHLLALKEELAPGSDGQFGAFRKSAPSSLDSEGAPVEHILCALGADQRSGNNPDELEAEVQRRLDTCVRALLPFLRRVQESKNPE